jgi:hypothetical protein
VKDADHRTFLEESAGRRFADRCRILAGQSGRRVDLEPVSRPVGVSAAVTEWPPGVS